MRTDRVIFRSILTTLVSVIALFGVMLLLLCLIFPATMMEITFDLGMMKSSEKYAGKAYNRTGDVYYAARAMETSVLLEDMAKIEENGLLFIQDDEFLEYCQIRNESVAKDNETAKEDEKISSTYQQYVFGQVTMAQYAQGKKTEAIGTAFASLGGGFPKNNAAAWLYLTANKTGDTDTALVIKTKLETLLTSELPEADKEYLQKILGSANA